MKGIKLGIIFVLVASLFGPFIPAQAAAPTAHTEEWTYLWEQGIVLDSEMNRDWKQPITRMDAVIYLARALGLEKPVVPAEEVTEPEAKQDNASVDPAETEEPSTEEQSDTEEQSVVDQEEASDSQATTEEPDSQNTLEEQESQVPSEEVIEEVEQDVTEESSDASSEEYTETEQETVSEETIAAIQAEKSLFSDVSVTDENYWMIVEFHKRGIISGYPDGTFRPKNPLNRADMARVITLTFKLTGTAGTVFSDVSTKAYYYNAVQSMVANEITVGYPDHTYRPTVATTHEHVLLFIARTMEPLFRVKAEPLPPPPPPPAPKPEVCEKKMSIPHRKIGVQAANFWKKPNQSRIIDAPASTNPTDLRRWSASLSENQSWWLVNYTDTQALYGDTVTVSAVNGDWYKVATKDQWVPYNAAGYPGWVPASQIVKSYYDYSDCRIAIVHAKTTWLKDAGTNKNTVEISYSTILPVVGEETNNWIVAAPNDKKMRVAKTDVKVHKNYASVPKPSATTVINEAKRFLGLRYIWSGTSAYGFDCSGILYAIMRTHGVLIPRDSFYQATKGTWISKSSLRAGDFVFFAGNSGTGKVYHVGLYLGDGMMLHAPNASSSVRIERYDNGAYKKNYHSARRYIQ